MPFDFTGREAQRETDRKKKEQQELVYRDERSATARELCQDISKYIEQKGLKYLSTVEGNVATISKGTDRLIITVLGRTTFSSREEISSGKIRDARVSGRINSDHLNQNEMVDVVIDWLAEE